MLKLFERELKALDHRLVVLAPPQATLPGTLENVAFAPGRHRKLLNELQRLRGSVYLRDGALRESQLTSDGRHETPEDEKSWHLLVTDDQGSVAGCIWYLEHEDRPALEELRVRECPLVHQDEWRDKLRSAVESETARAQREAIAYAEVGGWAVECRTRCLSAGLLLVLGTYSLSQLVGGALVIATATVRHSSAKILRRLGGSHLEADGCAVPSYYDPRYDCEMELLRFDTRRPTAKYADAVRGLRKQLMNVEVIASGSAILGVNPFRVPAELDRPLVPAYAAALA